MKITQIECHLLEYPLPAPLNPAWAPGRTFLNTACTLVKVHTDEGITGMGAGPDVGLAGLYTISDMVSPYILGKDPFLTEQISPYLRNAAHDGSYPWSIEMACWDIIGKACSQPVYRLWGGFRQNLPAYASLAELPSPAEQVERVQRLKGMGFGAVKVRLRRPSIAEDIALVETLRKEMGTEMDIMADANQANVMPSPNPYGSWTFEQALKVAHALHELGVLWLEEPLPRYNTRQLTRLTAAAEIPIAGGELNHELHEYRTLVEQDCYDIIQADCAFSEGIFQLRKVAALAEMHFKHFIPHTWSNGIGLGANLHLAASLPNCPWFEVPIDPPAWTAESRDFMLTSPYQIDQNGTIKVPDAPGWGCELDESKITSYTKHSWKSERIV